MKDPEISDVYFRRFVVPIVVTILIFAFIIVIITNRPGTDVDWSALIKRQAAGALRKFNRYSL